MAFAGVSVIADGKLSTTQAFHSAMAHSAGYHLLVVEGHSRAKAPTHYGPIVSRHFAVGGHWWQILCYPEGYCQDDHCFISLCIHRVPDGRLESVKVNFEFSFVDESEKQEPARMRASSRVLQFDVFSSHGYYGRFVKRETLEKSKHFKNDSFTIRCDVLVAGKDMTSPCNDVPPSQMKENFTDLLLAGEGTDVVFRVGDETIAAHRCFLAARSTVFKASLFGPMKEGSTSTVVQINDMDATVFRAMLAFIYGDSLPAEVEVEQEDGVLFQHLLVAADRYALQRLKAMCEKKLHENIGVSTTTSILALAEQHRCNGLKEACYEFLRCPANLEAVVATDGFGHLCRSCPSVMKGFVVAVGKLHLPKKE